MPFTFAHPAVVLPLRAVSDKYVSMIGLVIGSITPDFEYFFRLKVESKYSHTWAGLFWFDLPLGLILACTYRYLIKDKLIDHLPAALNKRFSAFSGNKYRRSPVHYFVVLLFSVLIGAATHLFWDSFTHTYGYFVMHSTFLSGQIQFFHWFVYRYKIVQHVSTLTGFLVIAFAIYSLPIGRRSDNSGIKPFWLKVFFITAAFLAVRFLSGLSIFFYFEVLICMLSAALVGVAGACILTRKAGEQELINVGN